MADLVIYGAKTSEDVVGSAARINVKGTRRGDVFTADQLYHYAMQGRLFKAATGLSTTPVTFKTGFTLLQPELAVDSVATVAILPVHLEVYLEAATGTVNEVVLQSTTSALGAGTSTAVTIAAVGRNDGPVTSQCSAYSLYSANGAAQTGINQIWRQGNPIAAAAGTPNKFEADVRSNLIPHWVMGVGGLQVYVGATSTASTGFIILHYLEVPVTDITG